MKKISILLFYLTINLYLHGQVDRFHFFHITGKDGLSDQKVRAIAKDKYGFMWFGTANGLNRYDGYNIKSYLPDRQDSTSIPDYSVTTILPYNQNQFWIGFTTGLIASFDYQTQKFLSFSLNEKGKIIPDNLRINDLIISPDSNLWISTSGSGIFVFDPKKRKIIDHYNSGSASKYLISNYIHDLLLDSENNIWFFSGNKLTRINTLKKQLKNYPFTDYQVDNKISALIELDENNLVASLSGIGIFKFNKSSGIFSALSNKKGENIKKDFNRIFSIVKDFDGKLWITTEGDGIYVYFPKSGLFKNILSDYYDEYGLLDESVLCSYCDDLGNIWLGGRRHGISVWIPDDWKFELYYSNPFKPDGLISNTVLAFIEDKDKDIWVGTDFGYGLFNHGKANFEWHYFNSRQIKGGDNAFNQFCINSKGTIYTNNYQNGVMYFDKKNREPSSINFEPEVYSMFIDSEDNLWLATAQDGLGLIKKNEKNALLYKHDSLNSKSIISNNLIRLCEDKNKNIWIGTATNGVDFLNRKTGEFAHYLHDPFNKNSISSNQISYLVCDKNGNIWVATLNAGISFIDLKSGKISRISQNDGLPSDVIHTLTIDKNGFLWITTENGLCRYNPANKSFKKFTMDFGLRRDQKALLAYYATNEHLYLGGDYGFSVFNPDSIKENKRLIEVLITDFKINNHSVKIGKHIDGRTILNKSITFSNDLLLNYSDRMISFEFAAIEYSLNKKNQYMYKLEGFDKDWIVCNVDQRIANYTNIDPGKYTFMVKATNNDGAWTKKPTMIHIVVKPPFWRSIWFKSLMVFLIIGSAFGYYKWRTSQLKMQRRNLEIKVKERTNQLEESKAKLEERQEEVLQQNEEILIQKETLQEKNAEIEKAYQELTIYEQQLEEIVKERTKELVTAKLKAEESDKLKSSFLANLSHEIRTPLNAIIGFSDLLIDGKAEIKKQEMFKSMIQSSSESLMNLINDILDLSKIEAGQIDIYKAPVNLSKILDEIKHLYNIGLEKFKNELNHDVEFRIHSNTEIRDFLIITDENRLKQILQNLINNALKFTLKGYIELSYELISEGKFLKFSLKDTGIGIKKENLSIIFNRFRKIENPATNLYRGTGLGLSICKHLVNLLGGEISVESELGVGSVFSFTIPYHIQNQVDVINKNQNPVTIFPNLKNKSILFAEDDDANYILAEIYLQKANAKIVRAANGAEAVQYFKENPNFDIVFLDIKMPIMDGFEALKHIRMIKNSAIIIAQTAHSYQEEIEKIKTAGFTDFLLKPINAKNLYLVIQSNLNKTLNSIL